jgi:nucleoside-diphosphate-sugar epimerase
MALEQTKRGTFNVGRDDTPYSMQFIAALACDLTGADDKLIQLVDPPAMQTVVKRLSTDRIRKLGWEPEIDIEEGMFRTLEWVKTLDATGAIAA